MNKRQIIQKAAFYMTGALILTSCEKVIDVDLNDSLPQIVIEGNITDQTGPYTVKLSKSVNFDELNDFPSISGATVQISDDAGNSEILPETSPGIYTTASLQGTPGRTYTLDVTIEEQTYTAVSTMPFPVAIDTLTVEEPSLSFGNGEDYIEARYKDPEGIDNYYRFVLLINNVRQKGIGVIIDRDWLQDGNTIRTSIESDEEEDIEFKPGDLVTVFMQSIDESVYEYYRTLNESGGNFSASPTNPLSNFSGGVLGYFSAYAVTSKTIAVP
jgi:hypothetical protein